MLKFRTFENIQISGHGPSHLDVSGDVVEAAPLLGGAVQGRGAASKEFFKD
jgi:hypothetical protein